MTIDPAILRRGRAGFTPVVFCSVDGRNITDLVRPRLIEATVLDGAGFASDGLTVVLDNADDIIARPRKKALVVFGGGFKETGGPLRLGSYEVEDAEKTFPKRTLTIVARAARIGDTLKERKNRAFEDMTVAEVIEQIAADHDLEPAVSDKIGSIKLPYRAQLGESDANLLSWLGQRFNAVASVKDGRLVFSRKGDAMTMSGKPLPLVTVGPDDIADACTFRGTARAAYGKVRAYWHDQAAALHRKVEEGDGELAAEITEPFQDEDEAREAVKGRKESLQREEETLSLQLWGRPDAQADAELMLDGCDKDADGKWSIETVEHKFSGDTAYTTAIEAKRGDSSKARKNKGGKKGGTPADLDAVPPPWEVPKGGY